MTIAVWLGSAAPLRSVRWLDGALAAAARLGPATAIAAGDASWLELAADRAARARCACIGVPTDLRLDYLGWAQIVAAVARELGAATILVDEASRPERAPEVGAIAELLDVAQLTRAIALWADGALLHASRAVGSSLDTVKLRGPAVIGVRLAAAALDEYPTPAPAVALRRIDLAALGLDPNVLAHRALPPRVVQPPRDTAAKVAEHLITHIVRQASEA